MKVYLRQLVEGHKAVDWNFHADFVYYNPIGGYFGFKNVNGLEHIFSLKDINKLKIMEVKKNG